MTKLHIQVNQTMQFYRGQQNGSAPQRVFLSGGAAIMPYTAQFFAEKLNVPVEYFNPFRNVQIDPSVNLEELARVAHSLGEVVGLGLRNLANCPVEMNLMPESTLRWRAFNEKKPYFLATIFLLALVAGAIGFLFQELASAKEKESSDLDPQVASIQSKVDRMGQAYKRLQDTLGEANQITTWMEDRYYWGNVFSELRRVLIRSEDEIKKKYSVQKPGMEAGIWVEQMTLGAEAASTTPAAGGTSGATPDQNAGITLVCRAVDLSGVDSAANNEIVYAVERELKNAPVFDPKTVQPSPQLSPVDANGTFTFTITVSPQNPLKL
jgi:outer membrane murein-binding lipoprotein Lpp